MPELIQTQTIDDIYNKFGFTRRSHEADKTGEGKQSNIWKGSIKLSTESPNINEIELARDFESMVMTGLLPMHGTGWLLSGINFNLNPSVADRAEMGDNITCIVTVNYRSYVKRLPINEALERMDALGIPVNLEPSE